MSQWRIELLSKLHRRASFDCGEESLNVFLHAHAGQNARKDISRTYVAVAADSPIVIGYYTLSSGSVSFDLIPDELTRRLPRYPVPTAHLARLAVHKTFQGQGLGAILLVNALKRVRDLAGVIGIHAVTVHALSDAARSFYEAFGFLALQDDPHHLFLPMATIRKI